jgi:hypothetical protein
MWKFTKGCQHEGHTFWHAFKINHNDYTEWQITNAVRTERNG